MSDKRQPIALVGKAPKPTADKQDGVDESARQTRGAGTGIARPPGSIDWPAVRRDYATGKLSNVELCRKHDLLPTTLSRRIRRDQQRDPTTWQRDLSGQVRTTTAALLLQEHSSGILKAGNEVAVVLAAATATRDVILGHRADVKAARGLALALLAELEAATLRPDALARLLAQAGADLDAAQRKALAADLQNLLLQLHQRVGSMQRLADTLAKLHTSERKAFGITDDEGGSDPVDAMSEADLEREIASLEAQRGGGLRLVGS